MQKGFPYSESYNQYRRHIIGSSHPISIFNNNSKFLSVGVLNNIKLEQIKQNGSKLREISLILSKQTLKREWYSKQSKKNKIKLIKLLQQINIALQLSIKSKKEQIQNLQILHKQQKIQIKKRKNNLINQKQLLIKLHEQYTINKALYTQELINFRQHEVIPSISKALNFKNKNDANQNLVTLMINKNYELVEKILSNQQISRGQDEYVKLIQIVQIQKEEIDILKQKVSELQKAKSQVNKIPAQKNELIQFISKTYSQNLQKHLLKNIKNLFQNTNQNTILYKQNHPDKFYQSMKQSNYSLKNLQQIYESTQTIYDHKTRESRPNIEIQKQMTDHIRTQTNNQQNPNQLRKLDDKMCKFGQQQYNIDQTASNNLFYNTIKAEQEQNKDFYMIGSAISNQNYKPENSFLQIVESYQIRNSKEIYSFNESQSSYLQQRQQLCESPIEEDQLINKIIQNTTKSTIKFNQMNRIIQQECQSSSILNEQLKETQLNFMNKSTLTNSIILMINPDSRKEEQQEKLKYFADQICQSRILFTQQNIFRPLQQSQLDLFQ